MKHLLKMNSPIHNLQVFLRTISREYPEIHDVIPDGVYGKATENAVAVFQRKFRLNDSGVTDYGTWDHIVTVYREIEAKSNAKPVKIYPEEDLNENNSSYKPAILVMQAMIYSLSEIFSNIPAVTISGIYDSETVEAVKSLQIISGLNPDGVINRTFWNYLASIYEAYVSTDRAENYTGD